jgi:hypothetical protein
MQTVSGWEGRGGVETCWRPYSAGVLHSVCVQIQNLLYKITYPPRDKNLEGERAEVLFKMKKYVNAFYLFKVSRLDGNVAKQLLMTIVHFSFLLFVYHCTGTQKAKYTLVETEIICTRQWLSYN